MIFSIAKSKFTKPDLIYRMSPVVFIDRPLRLAVRTPPFHGGNAGSIPAGVTRFIQLTI